MPASHRSKEIEARGLDLADRIVAARDDAVLTRMLIVDEVHASREIGMTQTEFNTLLIHTIEGLRDVLNTATVILDEETHGSFTEAFQTQQLLKAAIQTVITEGK